MNVLNKKCFLKGYLDIVRVTQSLLCFNRLVSSKSYLVNIGPNIHEVNTSESELLTIRKNGSRR